MPATWECPSCHRRVPENLDECRCGMMRAVAEASQARSAIQKQGLPRDVILWLGAMVVILLLGVLWLMRSSKPERVVPVLGYVDRPVPTPPPRSPSPSPSPR